MGDMRSATVTRREWVTCFLSCVFDLDAGQTVEACYPQGVLTPGESKGIAYGAFPVCTVEPTVNLPQHIEVMFPTQQLLAM